MDSGEQTNNGLFVSDNPGGAHGKIICFVLTGSQIKNWKKRAKLIRKNFFSFFFFSLKDNSKFGLNICSTWIEKFIFREQIT